MTGDARGGRRGRRAQPCRGHRCRRLANIRAGLGEIGVAGHDPCTCAEGTKSLESSVRERSCARCKAQQSTTRATVTLGRARRGGRRQTGDRRRAQTCDKVSMHESDHLICVFLCRLGIHPSTWNMITTISSAWLSALSTNVET